MHDHQWSMKKLLRDIVLSATYRQDSRMTSAILEKDPGNRLLARGPRVRLSAEQIRDQALSVSGLLSEKMFGKSVMPYQPEGVWNSAWSGEYWTQSEGEDLYRRGVYTFLKRTSPYPSFMMFDASSREVCLSRRIQTNTPLQALVTMNDPTYVDASRSLAKQMISASDEPDEQIRAGYRRLLFRELSREKLNALLTFYQQALNKYRSDPDAAKDLVDEKDGSSEMAALTMTANVLLNLDEVITKE
jgi:hypothetical protein